MGGTEFLGDFGLGLLFLGAVNVRTGRGRRGVSGIGRPESELEVEITDAFLLKSARESIGAWLFEVAFLIQEGGGG